MDFELDANMQDIKARTRAFVADHIRPLEADRANFDPHENIDKTVLATVREKARAAGLWAPQAEVSRGGMGLGPMGWAVMYEEANRSIFGPVVFNCAAPDDGNISLLTKAGTDAQKEWWLQPLIDGKVSSAFAMTEPNPGGGSDPSMIQTTATLNDGVWTLKGRKWFITGAADAEHFIVIARTNLDPEDRRKHLTAFLFHKDQPGWEIVRRIGIMGPEEHGGHCEIKFDGLQIPDENRLGEVGGGLKMTQMRLGPARLTHCMRWLGLSQRCLQEALEYVTTREGFGIKLIDRESVQLKLGESAQNIQMGRLLVMHAAWKLEQGSFARKEISMAKNHVAKTLNEAADVGVQLCGAKGYSKDLVVEWIYRYARQAKLVDGASEVHNMVLAGLFRNEQADFWSWDV